MLKIGDNFAVGANALNIIVYEKHIGKKGRGKDKEIWREIGYFSTPENALTYLLHRHIKSTELKDLKTICQKIDEFSTLIKTLNLSREAL